MSSALKVLLVEDEAHDAELVLRVLKRAGMECTGLRVDTEPAFRQALIDFAPDVVLSDFSMPLFDGMSALALAHEIAPDLPFIFVSGTIGEQHAIRALKNGATDYVLKGDLARLVPAVERALEDVRLLAEQRRMQAALHHSEQRFLLAASTGDVWDWTVATGEAYLSHQWKQRLGYADDELPNTFEAWLDLLHPNDRGRVQAALKAHIEDHQPYDIECRSRTRGGDYRWSQVKGQALWDAAGRATYMAGSVVDITERKQAEIKVRRLNRVYAVLSGISSLIVRVRTRDELFREACRIAVEAGQFRRVWVGLLDDAGQTLQPAAWHGLGGDGSPPQALSVVADEQGDSGLAARALMERRPVIVEEPHGDARITLGPSLRSLAILPLSVGDETVGTLLLYAGEAGFFDATEMKLLQELASDISFALDHLAKAEKLRYLAYYDELTGLANRSLFLERVSQYVETARRDKHKLGVLAINIDRFKTINDSLGWAAGDDLLRQIAARFLRNATDAGWYARLDADHFAIVVPDIGSEESIARRIERNTADYFDAPFFVADAELRISARVGIALFPNDGGDADTLFRHAEAAAQKAKARGERYLFYAQDMTEKIAGTLALENKLRRALENQQFVLHYQPKVDSNTRRVLSVEALIRWHDPELGLVPPMHFIPLMEETGMIIEVGAWALQQAARDHARWRLLGLAVVPRVAVNVSPIQLRKNDFVDTVRTAIALGAAEPGIDLEITESLIMEDIASNIEKLQALRTLGLSLAVDDFGTGYSSLRYLAQLPVQTLKIDRSFIITMLKEPDTMTLVATVISLAHSLRLRVVAEGVETEAQAARLQELGCDEMQGYLFSRPVSFEAMTALLQQPEQGA